MAPLGLGAEAPPELGPAAKLEPPNELPPPWKSVFSSNPPGAASVFSIGFSAFFPPHHDMVLWSDGGLRLAATTGQKSQEKKIIKNAFFWKNSPNRTLERGSANCENNELEDEETRQNLTEPEQEVFRGLARRAEF